MSYEAIICRVHTRPHPGADRLLLGTAASHQVIVGMDTQDGDLGVFFPSDGQLSLEYCQANKLLREDGGYIEKNRRVRTLRLRGEKSEGLWMPLSSLDGILDLGAVSEGQLIADKRVCRKYISPATRRAQQRRKFVSQKLTPDFKQHFQTPKVRYNLHKLIGKHAVITEKLHGTSGRTGRLLTEQKRTWVDWLLRRTRYEYEYVTGTRRTVLGVTGDHHRDPYRVATHRDIESRGLRKGETLYYEIVGFDGMEPIMPPHTVPDDSVGEIIRTMYGPKVWYRYGCRSYQYKVYVYRITMTVDGEAFDLSWDQVQQRCEKLGLTPVPELRRVTFGVSEEQVKDTLEGIAYGPSWEDHSHPMEGVCVRVGDDIYKYKTFDFCHLEGIAKNSDEYVDPEEAEEG